ncbi:MAG: hypothetical protein ACXWG0_06495, partial [Chthoniobacterales bacterium]
IDPESPGPLLGLARAALAAKDFEAAARHARESIGLLFFQPRAHYIHGLAQYRLEHWEEVEQAFLLCVRQAPLFAAAFRMLSKIARWHKKDLAQLAVYQVKIQEARRRLMELRKQKTAQVHAAVVTPAHGGETRAMPELKLHPEAFAGVPSGKIITVVSGLPRSGTSLMMQILEAAGIPAFSDNKRKADESNRKGYYEHEKVASLLSSWDRSWLKDARGSAIKIVAPLLAVLPQKLKKPDSEPELLHYRIIFMERDMEEILQSQSTMLARLGKSPAVSQVTPDISKAYRQQERHARSWCIARGIHAMSVSFETLVHQPDEILPRLSRFLGATDKLAAMRACIDPALHRVRTEPCSPQNST